MKKIILYILLISLIYISVIQLLQFKDGNNVYINLTNNCKFIESVEYDIYIDDQKIIDKEKREGNTEEELLFYGYKLNFGKHIVKVVYNNNIIEKPFYVFFVKYISLGPYLNEKSNDCSLLIDTWTNIFTLKRYYA